MKMLFFCYFDWRFGFLAPQNTQKTIFVHLCRAVVRKVVDINPQESIGPSKGLVNSHRVECGSVNNCWGLLEQ